MDKQNIKKMTILLFLAICFKGRINYYEEDFNFKNMIIHSG